MARRKRRKNGRRRTRRRQQKRRRQRRRSRPRRRRRRTRRRTIRQTCMCLWGWEKGGYLFQQKQSTRTPRNHHACWGGKRKGERLGGGGRVTCPRATQANKQSFMCCKKNPQTTNREKKEAVASHLSWFLFIRPSHRTHLPSPLSPSLLLVQERNHHPSLGLVGLKLLVLAQALIFLHHVRDKGHQHKEGQNAPGRPALAQKTVGQIN